VRLAPRGVVVRAALTLAAGRAACQTERAAGTVLPAAARSGEPAGEQPIGTGDRLVIRVWREPAWSDSTTVDLAGGVTLPRIGRVRAVGLAPAAFRDTVRARFAVYLREPVVDIVVLHRVAVQGAVRKPDVLYVDPTMTLREIIAKAGGVDEDGNPDRIEILRDGARIRLGRWSDIATASELVHSGDQVIVGRRGWLARNALAVVSSLAVAVSVVVSATR
jgi:protein involved in polysaccharide export with SLBB domain